jgi:hypothetical protein
MQGEAAKRRKQVFWGSWGLCGFIFVNIAIFIQASMPL